MLSHSLTNDDQALRSLTKKGTGDSPRRPRPAFVCQARALLGDIAHAASEAGPLRGSLVTLQKNYRFGTVQHGTERKSGLRNSFSEPLLVEMFNAVRLA